MAEAKDMFISTLRWRDTFNVDAAVKEEFPDDVFGKLGMVHGKDKEGHPVTYVFLCGYTAGSSKFMGHVR